MLTHAFASMADVRHAFALLAAVDHEGRTAHAPLTIGPNLTLVPASAKQGAAKVYAVPLPGTTLADGVALVTELPTHTAPASPAEAPRHAMDVWVLSGPRYAPSAPLPAHTPAAWVPLSHALETDAAVTPLRFVPPAPTTTHPGAAPEPLMCTTHAANGSHAGRAVHLPTIPSSTHPAPLHIVAHHVLHDASKATPTPPGPSAASIHASTTAALFTTIAAAVIAVGIMIRVSTLTPKAST